MYQLSTRMTKQGVIGVYDEIVRLGIMCLPRVSAFELSSIPLKIKNPISLIRVHMGNKSRMKPPRSTM